MSLIQVHVDDDVRARADAAFAKSGITTPMAVKMMVTQAANRGCAPMDGAFTWQNDPNLTDDVRRDMIYAEAQEYGLIPDDAQDALRISDAALAALGLTPDEVGQ